MKIAVASDNQINVTGHLGRCRGFLVYEIEEDEVVKKEYRENVFTNHWRKGNEEHHEHRHGHGHGTGHARLVNGLKDCKTIIFSSGGWRVIDDLTASGIKPFVTDESIADDAINKYLKGELIEKEDGACHHHE